MRSHHDADARSLALHAEVAKILANDPSIRDRARLRLARLHAEYRDAWERLLDGSLDELLATLVDPSPRATALRQASPFSFALDHATRWRILRATRTQP